MKENNMDFVTRYYILQNELYKAFLILIEKKGENGVLNLKGLGVTFDRQPIASVKINKYSIYFLTDNDEYYGFYSADLKDMCCLYNDITEALE